MRTLGSCPVGTIVYLKVGSEYRQFKIRAISHYISGYVTLMVNKTWVNGYPNYFSSRANAIISEIDEEFRNLIPSVSSRGRLFLPTCFELGNDKKLNDSVQVVGTPYPEFTDISVTVVSSRRKLSDSKRYWTATTSTDWGFSIGEEGKSEWGSTYYNYGYAFVLNLPSHILVADDGKLVNNQPPTIPASITMPETVLAGQGITITWEASTDPEGDEIGYELDRTFDEGSSWSNRYKGNELSATGVIPEDANSVMYRVRAFDTAGNYSGYRVSVQKDVIHNQPPTVPGSINVPVTVRGGGMNLVTWTESYDPDQDPITYSLERQTNSGAWQEIYSGSNLSYSDNIEKGLTSVAWRVRAYDSKVYSDYRTSVTKQVINNTPPVIDCTPATGSDLGIKSEPFDIKYTVTDADNDEVTVVEKIDDKVVREHKPTLGEEQTFSVTNDVLLKVTNGSHTLEISASDGTETVYHTLTFTKQVTKATIKISEPMEQEEAITLCAVTVLGKIPADAVYTVEATNNAMDDEPVWEDITSNVKAGLNYVFTNHTAVNGNYFSLRATIERGPSGESGYISSVQGAFQ